ncbi:RHS repeat-associated core domain-containing protein [Pseudomonas sp. TH41]|uniref:RHS repeat-associated core domain-containing protein n=1 Tax=Pseudomonas sp. TH41 TaxID=2796405 RepID=UPI00313F08C6
MAYSAYGHQSGQQEVATQLGFNGQVREANIGWYLLGNGYRAYNPRLMRFHSPDSWSPFGRGGLNAYMYCVGDPVNHSDPTGHSIFGAISLLVKENVSFGGSAAQLAAKNVTRRANGITRQQAMYGLAAAGGTPTLNSRPSTSCGLAGMLGYVAGAPGPRGNSSPAVQYTETTPSNHLGYAAGAAAAGLVSTPSSTMPRSPGIYSASGGGGGGVGPRSSFDNPRILYDGPPPREPVLVHERLLGGAPPSGAPDAATNTGPSGGSYLPTPLRSIPGSPTSSRWSGESGPSDWSSSSSSSSSRSSSPVLATLIRKGDGTSQTRWV